MTLSQQIQRANSIDQLKDIVSNIPNNPENGLPTKVQRILENAFWYDELIVDLEKTINWMLIRVEAYNF